MPTLPALLFCTIVGVNDGDTIKARCATDAEPQTITIRLAEIDAPERAQAFGQRSKQHLSATCYRKRAEVYPVAIDRYKRTVARVRCEGTDASSEQVRAGMAWVFIRYAAKTSPLPAIETDAKLARRGLWIDAEPVSPWDWRRTRRPEFAEAGRH